MSTFSESSYDSDSMKSSLVNRIYNAPMISLQPAEIERLARDIQGGPDLWKLADFSFRHYLKHTIKYVKSIPGLKNNNVYLVCYLLVIITT